MCVSLYFVTSDNMRFVIDAIDDDDFFFLVLPENVGEDRSLLKCDPPLIMDP